ncbi:SRPBCC family protein [Ornithinimicrobium cavernae]|uniref:SRPBCC family protein n=1 Tax=Ornithinimicrobium cavernae TaxID=2666047 RepID=UPI000D699733|nr:SRPBCC family protein [Ornithinimicrobium cavernae]
MAVDVLVETVIDRPLAEVSAFAGDPSNAPRWYANIRSVEWRTAPPLLVGSRFAFVAHFLGRRLAYVYEVTEHVPGTRLVMETDGRPFPMRTTYTWEPAGAGGTRMTLANSGRPTGFAAVGAGVMARAMRAATTKDLARLKRLLESERSGA